MADVKIDTGVIGLAVARELALAGREVVVVEAAERIGTGISSRNSEVIHAGIYDPQGSLKAITCVQGRKLLYHYCKTRNIPFKRCGKLIVASGPDQFGQLAALQKQAQANQVRDVEFLHAAQVREMEPEIRAAGALFSPTTGIVDSHSLMLNLHGDIEAAGGSVVFKSAVVSGVVKKKQILLRIASDQSSEVEADVVINAAGLHANQLLANIQGYPQNLVRPLYLAKGDYFSLSGNAPFEHLIYPLPDAAGLGIHLTLDLAGQARFGPDAEWVENIAYEVQADKDNQFRQAISQYWPGIATRTLLPAYAGVRPKLKPEGVGIADFVLETPAQHGVRGWYILRGMESPG